MKRLALMVLALLAAPAAAQELHDALEAGDLICEIRHGYRRNVFADLSPSQPAIGLMLVYESIGAQSARVVSSQRPGKHPVQVRVTANAVHFIEPVGPSVRQTTLTRCEKTGWTKKGYESCVRFAARHVWHFDTSAYADPDAALARLGQSVSTGSCEPWAVD